MSLPSVSKDLRLLRKYIWKRKAPLATGKIFIDFKRKFIFYPDHFHGLLKI